jgi:CheY-like chemotaxis protein
MVINNKQSMDKTPLLFLVDDDQDDQHFFEMAVTRLHTTVHCKFADDGTEALDILLTNTAFQPDFIFLDVNMPLLNGMQCLSEIRKIERLNHVPVYMCSTSADGDIAKNCLAMGANGVIKKASSIEEIKQILDKIIFQ